MGKLGDIAAILGLGIVGGVLFMFATGRWKFPELRLPTLFGPAIPSITPLIPAPFKVQEILEPILKPKAIITPETVAEVPVVPITPIPIEPVIAPIVPTAPVVPVIPPIAPYPPRITPEEVVLPTLPSLAPVIIPREPRIPTGEWEEPWKMEPTPYWKPPPPPTLIEQTGRVNNGQITEPVPTKPRIFRRIVRGH